MKLLVIGCGQCGGRIADQFAQMGQVARQKRGISIVSNVIAVNTDIADLSGLVHIKPDYKHRILIGAKKTSGHGVGKINELGAQLAKEDGDRVLDAVKETRQLIDTDAVLLVAAASGGTGSGAISVLTRQLRERYPDKPIYNMVVLPFNYEERTEERTVYNAGTCLKSCYLVADAVILADNQRFLREEAPISTNLDEINQRLVSPFYNLLCAGEEITPRFVGSKVLDAGDIIQTLSGWSVVGHSTVRTSRLPFQFRPDFRGKHDETQRGIRAMDEALAELPLKVIPADARRALYLLTAPSGKMSMEIIKELSQTLKSRASEAIIRSGDYPRSEGSIDVTVVLSELVNVGKVVDYFDKTISYVNADRHHAGEGKPEGGESFQDIPSLFD